MFINSDLFRIFVRKYKAVVYFKVISQHFPEARLSRMCARQLDSYWNFFNVK